MLEKIEYSLHDSPLKKYLEDNNLELVFNKRSLSNIVTTAFTCYIKDILFVINSKLIFDYGTGHTENEALQNYIRMLSKNIVIKFGNQSFKIEGKFLCI